MTTIARGLRLASSLPGSTSDVLAFTATIDTEIKRVFVCNVSAASATFRIHHVGVSESVSATNALYYDKTLASNETFEFSANTDDGIQLKPDESVYVRSSVASALSFNIYGVTADLAPGGQYGNL